MAARRAAMKAKSSADKVIHPPYIKTNIPAGGATTAPPLGPQIGQRGAQIGPFCKQFNEMTADLKPGLQIPTFVRVNPNKTTEITLYKPPTSFFLKMAAGVSTGGRDGNDIAGKVTLKHVYEIAKIKSSDPPQFGMTMEEICKMIIGTAHSINIQVVREYDPYEYAEFLEGRRQEIILYQQDLEEKRKAKLLRL